MANKFGAKKTVYNGVTYDSKKEAHRRFHLDCLAKKGDIVKIEDQPVFDIVINDTKVCKYKADFRVTYKDGSVEVEDVKGLKKGAAYQIFRLKKKLVKAIYNVDIIEI